MDEDDDNDTFQTFTHDELQKITSSVLKELICKDSYLLDLPGDVTLDEVNNQIALLHGKSITINIVRGEEVLSVIVPQAGSKVFDLKKAIKRALTLQLEREEYSKRKKTISWRHVWKTWNLECNGTVLENDNVLLQEYQVSHKAYVKFIKKRRKKMGKFK